MAGAAKDQMMINEDRLRRTFLDLVQLNSPPGEEREVRRYCRARLEELDFVCQEDASGNLLAQRSGPVAAAPRLFFSAHMDTVLPTEGIAVREEDGVFRTDGRTILGADDKCAIAEIFEGIAALTEAGRPHGDLQVVLSVREEIGLVGAKEMAVEALAGGIGFVLDASGPTGCIITAAPSHAMIEARFRGQASHAGFRPEDGISAVRAAAIAVAGMRLGRIDEETTANVGVLRGGSAGNVVPEEAYLRAEARSRDNEKLAEQVAHLRACLEEGARTVGATVEVEIDNRYTAYRFEPTDPGPALAARAWERLGGEPVRYRPTGGGADASIFNMRGLHSVVLSCGYQNAHSAREFVAWADLLAGARWVAAIAEEAAAAERSNV